MKCKQNWDVAQHVKNTFMIKDQLTAVNASVTDPIFIQMSIQSLPANALFDRLRDMVESGDDKVGTPGILTDQIYRRIASTSVIRSLVLLVSSEEYKIMQVVKHLRLRLMVPV